MMNDDDDEWWWMFLFNTESTLSVVDENSPVRLPRSAAHPPDVKSDHIWWSGCWTARTRNQVRWIFFYLFFIHTHTPHARTLSENFSVPVTTGSITLITESWSWSACTEHRVNPGASELNIYTRSAANFQDNLYNLLLECQAIVNSAAVLQEDGGGSGDNRNSEDVQRSDQITTTTPDALPVTRQTASKHWWHCFYI